MPWSGVWDERTGTKPPEVALARERLFAEQVIPALGARRAHQPAPVSA